MRHQMSSLIMKYREFWNSTAALVSTTIALTFFLASLVINFHASQYAYINQGNHLTDIVLDNIPVMDMSTAFIGGTIVFVIFIIMFLLHEPRQLPFAIKTISFFIVIRSFFIILTHMAPSPLSSLGPPSEIGRIFTSGADLFFSGHTGMPYLFALLYWQNVKLRALFLGISIFAAAGVLLGHIHYSIDVASAYFITHGIYLLAIRFFPKDWRHFNSTM